MKKNKLNTQLLLMAILVIFYIVGLMIGAVSYWAIWVILFSLLVCRNAIGKKELLIVSLVLFWCNYSIVLCQLDLISGDKTTYTKYNGTEIAEIGMRCLYVFTGILSVLTLGMGKKAEKLDNGKKYYFNDFDGLKGDSSSFGFGILVFGLVVTNAGFYLTNQLGYGFISKSYFEYSVILYILGFCYARYDKTRKIIMLILFFLGLAIDLSLRDRIVPLEMMIMGFVIFFQYKLNKKQLSVILTVLLVFMVFFGNNREGQAFTLQSITDSFDYLFGNKLTLDTSYAAYLCSLSEIDYGQTLRGLETTEFLKSYIIYIFVGQIPGNEMSNLAQYVLDEGYVHTYGNVSPVMLYFYMKTIGVVLFSLLIGMYYKMTAFGKTQFAKCLSVYFVSLGFRWYLYGPASILRGVLIFTIIYFIFSKLFGMTGYTNQKTNKQVVRLKRF